MAKNRSELVSEVAEKAGVTQKQVSDVLDGVFEVFSDVVSKGDKLTVPGWLSVERTERSARKGRNPQTGEEIEIKAGYSVKVSAGSKLKAAAGTPKGK
ncbi:HU family DNA-binding protein [Saxibacter everestensis]|uniref:HU family DNA-binding protein n=1 Tax=Saxibacter everestensis TaxID=2909229 RepID=A0ABY8QSK2_9MICO|nr:HU family DNA-binding protein [Brevibacteriaceae bacterium ZFBP1038]